MATAKQLDDMYLETRHIDIITAALDLKEQSIRRAKKSANAKFQVIYDQELLELAEARAEISKAK